MAITPSSNQLLFNSTTEVTLVPAPGAGVSHTTLLISIHNKDTEDVVVIIEKAEAANRYRISKTRLSPDGRLALVEKVMLTGTTHSVIARLEAVVAANQPEAVISYIAKS